MTETVVLSKRMIEYPECGVCDNNRRHPPGAPHKVNGQYFESEGDLNTPMPLDIAKLKHRRASVRAAVTRHRDKQRVTA